jgi:hypothetical protein
MGMICEGLCGSIKEDNNVNPSTYAVVVERLRVAIRATAKPYDTIMVLSFLE